MLQKWDSHPNSVNQDAEGSIGKESEEKPTKALDEHFGNLGQALLRAKTNKEQHQSKKGEVQEDQQKPRGKLSCIDVVKRSSPTDDLAKHFDGN